MLVELQILGNRFELCHRGLVTVFYRVLQAVVDMIMNQRFLGLVDRLLDRLQLLRDIEAGATRLQHFNDALQVAIGPL